MEHKLTKLIQERHKKFDEYTYMIFEELSHVIDAIRIYLSALPENDLDKGIIAWEDISLYDEFIMISGMLTYNVGAIIKVDEDIIEITEENATYFQRVIRVGLPVEIIVKGNTDDIVNYLWMLHAKNEAYENDDIMSETMAGPKISEHIENEFDLDGLSEEQKELYKLSTLRGTIN